MGEKIINPINVHNYLFITGENEINAKRLRRKFNKKKIKQFMQEKKIKKFTEEIPDILYTHLATSMKKVKRNIPECIGVFTDNNVVTHNIMTLPPPPLKWDILCCESKIKNYNYEEPNNNIYWCSSEISDSRHFVINWQSIKKVLCILKGVKDWGGFIKEINKQLSIYTITQYNLSEAVGAKLSSLVDLKLNKFSITNMNNLVNDYDKRISRLSVTDTDIEYKLLPKISLVCIATTTDHFFHSLYTFLKIDYPRDKLQLVVVDDQNLEKKIKGGLPEDSRIKIINISIKDREETSKYVTLPLGYKLNTGIKYSDNEMIYNLFDTNHYFISNFKDIVKTFIMTKECHVLTSDTSAYIHENNSYIKNLPSIRNMLYLKAYWKVDVYDEHNIPEDEILYNFIKRGNELIYSLPFIKYSFQYDTTVTTTTTTTSEQIEQLESKELGFNLESILDPLTSDTYKKFC